ncbi:hypothetical protein PVMG_05619 [Plasmodium vivax Mauritania I]|uniref:VIR protein n=1 Tax=Plasmodium vivax Mauritania I TaxID=1035515 RepID=A0A0J9TH61_PLAVI|nr:hypothetical protein PVMG_05619 [Plasmodium vivax Mauritania I]
MYYYTGNYNNYKYYKIIHFYLSNIIHVYLDYKCYTRLKDYFDLNVKSTNNSENFDKIIKSAQISLDNNLSNNKILQKLEQHLKGHGVFYDEDDDECCKYINFWLNKVVKEKHYSLYNDSNFHIFKDFVEHFNYVEHSLKSKRCLSNINHIKVEIFEKMSKLYELYEYFTELKKPSPYTKYYETKTKCEVFGQLIADHNQFIKEYQDTDTFFIKRLMNLKGLIEKEVFKFEKPCPYKTSELNKSQLEIERDNAELQRQQEATRRQQEEATRRQQEEATREAARQRITTLPLGNDVFDITGEQGYQVDNEMPRLKDYTQHELERYTGTSKGRGYFDNNVLVQHQDEKVLPTSSSDMPEHTSNIFTDRQGTMGKITGAITDVFGQVDPVPVVGVSGGMGALFLLFRVFEILNLHPYNDNISI